MQYDETRVELPVIEQLTAAVRQSIPGRVKGQEAAKQGQNEPAVFEFLQPTGLKQLIPFSATDFNGTLSEFERDLKGATAVGRALLSLSRFISLAANTADAAVSQVTRNLTLSSQSKRDTSELGGRLAAERIESATTEILTAAAIDEIDKIARLEHKTKRADFQRLSDDQGRDLPLASATPSQTFEVLMKAYQLTKRTPEVVTALCRTPEAMLERFQELKRGTLSY